MRCSRMYVGFYVLTDRRRHSHCCLENVSGVKNGREVLKVWLASVELKAYQEIVKILFSPKVISTTPSSQPELCQPVATFSGV